MNKRTTIFRQLILNVVMPAVLALGVLGLINYHHTKSILVGANQNKNSIIIDEIRNIHEMQDMALDILEEELQSRMREKSGRLVNEYFKSTDGIDTVDLSRIREALGMEEGLEDIYIINRQGIVVNTTFEKDMDLNIFEFGEGHRKLIERVFSGGVFVNEKFAVENNTKRLKKFTYEPTLDRNYIIELGVYSQKADRTISAIKKRMNELSAREDNIISVDLFIGMENPFSLNQDVEFPSHHMDFYRRVMENKESIQFTDNIDGQKLSYNFVYLERKNTSLYRESVIRIISDRKAEQALLRREMFKFFVFFGMTMFVVIILLYRKTKVITDPIKNLLDKVNRITEGHLNERADIHGNNEIASLSEQFNRMIEQLESYYNDLEEMVKQRTSEILAQKKEIESQRDAIQEQRNILSEFNHSLQNAYSEIEEKKKHIEYSIHYAKRIQNAILPPDDYVKSLMPESFIYYKPKDIVSGDFYWVTEKKSKIFVAVVDCTGHGVPGAFMSIVGNNQLNYIVNVKGIIKPSDILNSIDEGVTQTLRQTPHNSSVRDGMDIGLISIDIKSGVIEFAGAFISMYIVRDRELIKIDSDKFAVGGYMGEQLRRFTNHTFNFQKDDIVYLFSDGYSDQFGGHDDTKFMIKRFRELLMQIHREPIGYQPEILDRVFEDWRGETYQIDDILVIGIKF